MGPGPLEGRDHVADALAAQPVVEGQGHGGRPRGAVRDHLRRTGHRRGDRRQGGRRSEGRGGRRGRGRDAEGAADGPGRAGGEVIGQIVGHRGPTPLVEPIDPRRRHPRRRPPRAAPPAAAPARRALLLGSGVAATRPDVSPVRSSGGRLGRPRVEVAAARDGSGSDRSSGRPASGRRPRSAADLAHASLGPDEVHLVDRVAGPLGADRPLAMAASSSSLAPAAQRAPQVVLVDGEQAVAQLALGGEADAVARAAERRG